MGLSPNEIRNHEFSTAFRGYTRSEVEAFREAAAAALEEARTEILKLDKERALMAGRYQDLKDLEETLKSAVVEAQKSSEQVVANAKKEAELIIAEAKKRRDGVIEEKHRHLAEVESQIHQLELKRDNLYNRLKVELETHLRLINQLHPDSGVNRNDRNHRNPGLSHRPASGHSPQIPAGQNEASIDRIVEQFRQEQSHEQENE